MKGTDARKKMTKRTALIAWLVAGLPTLGGWECGKPIVDDPGFDLWCGKQLCSWKARQGSVERVATWHRADYGVELVGDPVVLTQLSKDSSTESKCYLFELLARYDEGVTITISMDFLDDGSVEYSHPLTTNNFEPARYHVSTPRWYRGVRFTVKKTGSGKAVLAHVRVTTSKDGCSAEPLPIRAAPKGVPCTRDSDCKSQHCVSVKQWNAKTKSGDVQVCSACRSENDCGGSEVCGVEAASDFKLYLGCGAAARHAFGERCAFDGECDSGVCCGGVCSTCCKDHPCSSGACEQRDWQHHGDGYQYQLLPYQCDPHDGLGVAGQACLDGDDCKSATCAGSKKLKVCWLDGRRCDNDDDCPVWPKCIELGTYEGRCR